MLNIFHKLFVFTALLSILASFLREPIISLEKSIREEPDKGLDTAAYGDVILHQRRDISVIMSGDWRMLNLCADI